jgi:hypothetical protein
MKSHKFILKTISKKFFLILFIAYAHSAVAQDERYRVEILVLTHLDHDAEPREYRNLDDYSQSIDYLTPPEEQAAESEDEADPPPEDEVLPPAEEEEQPRVMPVEEMSELMKENWRRLRLSGPFRPQQFLAWEQAADEPFPALRLHNLEVLLVEDPYADERALLAEQALQAAESGSADAMDPDESEEEPGLPDPTVYYQLDGTVTLRRSRFLHLDLRLDWREPVFAEVSDVPPEPLGEPDVPLRPESFLVHRLEQSRLVKTGQIEYFDHPVLGVLAFITRLEAPTEE